MTEAALPLHLEVAAGDRPEEIFIGLPDDVVLEEWHQIAVQADFRGYHQVADVRAYDKYVAVVAASVDLAKDPEFQGFAVEKVLQVLLRIFPGR